MTRIASFTWGILGILLCSYIASGYLSAQETVAEPKISDLVDKVIDVRLKDGSLIGNATVVTVAPGKVDDSIRSRKVRTPNSTRPTRLGASKIQEIYLNENPLDVTYDTKNRALVHSVEKMFDRKEHRRKVEERLTTNRDRYWEPLTEDDHKKFMKKHRLFLKKTETELPHIQFRLVETNYFLFFTNLPANEVDGYITYLDAMYREMCKAFGLSPDKNIWCGKCVVVAFGRRQDFWLFESKLMDTFDTADVQGLCHQFGDGTVIFAGYKGDNDFFGHVLVHETSHGFVHRYMTTARAPSWLNEGLSLIHI